MPAKKKRTTANARGARLPNPPALPMPQLHASEAEVVLVAVTGLTPAVLTETVWELAQRTPPVIPRRIITLTTSVGARALREQLIDARRGEISIWQQLYNQIAKQTPLGQHDLELKVRVFTKSSYGKPEEVAELIDEDDHVAVADALLETLWTLIRVPGSPTTHVIASIAGGFKTMSALMLSCMTLLGRNTDEITHVLAKAPFDKGTMPLFYFPAQSVQKLTTVDGVRRAQDAELRLTTVPFAPLSALFDRDLIGKPRDYRELIARCNAGRDVILAQGLNLKLARLRCFACINELDLKTSPDEHLLLLVLAEKAMCGPRAFATYPEAGEAVKGRSKAFATAVGADSDAKWLRELEEGDLRSFVTRRLDRLKTKLKRLRQVGERFSGCLPKTGDCRLRLEPGQITLID